jgi:hypothetical protein
MFRYARRSPLIVLIVFLAMTGCESPPSRVPFPEITFTHLPDIRLDVATIEIIEAYQSPGVDPNVEHLYPVTPAEAARRWAEDRLVAVGIDGFARFIILDASAVEQRNAPPPAGSSSADPRDRYNMRTAIRIEIVKANGAQTAFVAAEATLQQYVDPATTLNERERIWFGNVEALMKTLDAELQRTIDSGFGPYLR